MNVNIHPATHNSELAVRQAVAADRERISDWLHKESGHYGQTHYQGKKCFMCKALRMIDLLDDEGQIIVVDPQTVEETK